MDLTKSLYADNKIVMNLFVHVKWKAITNLFAGVLTACSFAAKAQLPSDTTFHVQYPAKGYMLLNSNEKVYIKGLNYLNSDSLILFERGTPKEGIRVYKNLSQLSNVHARVEAIENIKLLKEYSHATFKGAVAGAIIGFGLGYLAGYGSYEERFDRTNDENNERRKTRGGLYGIMGTVPVGLTGALIGSIVLKKRFTISGSKEKLSTALQKIY